MIFLYTFLLRIYSLGITIASPFNKKARLWSSGRRKVFENLKNSHIGKRPVIWIHTASLGEFEQGRPILERIKNIYPDHHILLTFFSPSGYEVRKNYKGADFISYLPLDTIGNARKFISIVKPQMVFFVKYEFWFNYINELYKQKIPLLFVSVIFRPSQIFFKPIGFWFAKQLNKISYLFVQNNISIKLLQNIGISHSEISGDTRFDRVIEIKNEDVSFPIIESYVLKSKILVGGSTWSQGEAIIYDLLEKSNLDFKYIIAPHLIGDDHINDILKRFKKYNPVRYSKANKSNMKNCKVLIIDEIGFLSKLYRYADVAYVGGGFGAGIHNLLEASTYGIPVLFGPNHKRFKEAIDLQNLEVGFSISSYKEAKEILTKLMTDRKFYEKCSQVSQQYVIENSGATDVVISKVKEFIVASKGVI